MPCSRPTLAFRKKRRLLPVLEGGGLVGDSAEKNAVLVQIEIGVLNIHTVLAVRKRAANFEQLLSGNGEEADLIKEPKQPGKTSRELGRCLMSVPHLHSAADKLISARALHSIDAQVCTTDADRVFCSPRSCRIVFRRNETVPWIQRRCHWGTEVDVT